MPCPAHSGLNSLHAQRFPVTLNQSCKAQVGGGWLRWMVALFIHVNCLFGCTLDSHA
jgi:hypothetical protein